MVVALGSANRSGLAVSMTVGTSLAGFSRGASLDAIQGFSFGNDAAGVHGSGTNGGFGVLGINQTTTGFGVKGVAGAEGLFPNTTAGVWGTARDVNGVVGTSTNFSGVIGIAGGAGAADGAPARAAAAGAAGGALTQDAFAARCGCSWDGGRHRRACDGWRALVTDRDRLQAGTIGARRHSW